MGIRDLSDEQLENMENNYRDKGVAEGGKYTLAEVRMEKLRRSGSVFSGKTVVTKIRTLANASDDGLTTYLDLWNDLYPDREWKGDNSRRIIMGDLDPALHYCVKHSLPIFTVLVVRTGRRDLTEKAINNIYDRCRELGVEAGPNSADFVAREREAALAFDISDLP